MKELGVTSGTVSTRPETPSEAQQRVEVLSVQHQDQAEDLPKLYDIHPTILASSS